MESNPMTIRLRGFKASADSASKKFIDRVAADSQPHPFNPRQVVLGQSTLELQIDINHPEQTVHITDIVSISTGGGRAALNYLCELADELHVTLNLFAKGYAHTNTYQLVLWYFENGFRQESDFDYVDIEEGVDMVRYPQTDRFILDTAPITRTHLTDRAFLQGLIDAKATNGPNAELANLFSGVSVKTVYDLVPKLYGFFAQ